MGNFKFKVALDYCKKYEEESKQTLNLYNDFITPSFIATIAAFVKSHNISGVIIGCSIPTNTVYTSTSNKDFDDLLSLMTK